MWEITLQKITGTYHELHGMLCQDQIFHQERNHCQSVVLADGTGNSDLNTLCVKEVVEFAAEILLEFVENGRAGRICREDVIRRLMQGVVRIISKYMDTYHLPAEAFASTLMGVAVNHVREEYLMIHLGDGIIVGKNGQQSCVLSYPVNRKVNETFLTISENLMERTRVKSGSLAEMTIDGYLRFGGDSSYYISANKNDTNYYINLPGLRVDKASSAVFSGKLSAPSGTIGGFTITTSSIYKTKTSYSDSNSGVYIGTTGIGLGPGKFYVTSAGKLYASDAEISGEITATSGTIGGFTIGASSLTNSNGGSSIVITSGDYKTTFSANSVSASYGSGDSFRGWSLGLNQFSLTGYTSSKYAGIKMSTSYKKRTSSSSRTNTTVAEGLITSARDTYYNADSGSTTFAATPFIIGIPRQYADAPYQPVYEWGAYARFVSYQSCELVYDSAYSGKWTLRNVSGSTYDLTDLIPHVKNHKFYFWKRTTSVSNDSRVSITKTTHGLSTVTGAIVIPREKSINGEGRGLGGDNNLINKRANYGIYISGTTVYVVVDSNGLPHGFNCIVYGY